VRAINDAMAASLEASYPDPIPAPRRASMPIALIDAALLAPPPPLDPDRATARNAVVTQGVAQGAAIPSPRQLRRKSSM